MSIRKNKIIMMITAVLILALIIAIFWLMSGQKSDQEPNGSSSKVEPFVVPPLGERYTNQDFGFSLSLPEGFSAREFYDEFEGIYYVILENDRAEGIQIAISPFDDIKILNSATIQNEVPDMEVSDPQFVEIGEDYLGTAFLSDNSAYGGASREVWFVFRSNLYQISTYERLDELLKEIFATWSFQ